jgi:hypothetical protein
MVQRTAAQRKQVREDDDLRTRTNAFANLERREEHIPGVNFRLGGGYPLRKRHEVRRRKHRKRDIV